jgi:putative glutamine amidotransferase
MTRPLIGITGRRRPLIGATVPPTFAGVATDVLIAAYAERVLEAGGIPVLVVQDPDVKAYADDVASRLDGLVIAGGADVGRAWYDPAADGPDALGPVPDQDAHEFALLASVERAGMPVLAICRGCQVLNVHRGGTLIRDLATAGFSGHDVYGDSPAEIRHRLAVAPGTRLHHLVGDHTDVNSYHHQAIDRLGAGLVVTARAPDGVIEAVEDPDRPVLGVQWHPEWLVDEPALFRWLVGAAATAMVGARL